MIYDVIRIIQTDSDTNGIFLGFVKFIHFIYDNYYYGSQRNLMYHLVVPLRTRYVGHVGTRW